MARNVATGAIGGGYGPYSYNPREMGSGSGRFTASGNSETSITSTNEKLISSSVGHQQQSSTAHTDYEQERERFRIYQQSRQQPQAQNPPTINTNTVPPYIWDAKDPDLDDALHDPNPTLDARLDRAFTLCSGRGWANVLALLLLACGLLFLFGAYPIFDAITRTPKDKSGYNSVNATGQINKFPNFPSLVDDDTPSDVRTRVGSDGRTYNLVFSDEFNRDGRTFYPGDDPYWEAVDLHYWPTGDVEWYDPGHITTANGKLVITMERKQWRNLNFVSGMLQSWNKLCFTTGYVELSVSLPGSVNAQGFWPGIWTMGNLGRAGYGATTEGMWPYSYDTCDLGTFPNQTAADGTPPQARTGGNGGAPLSYLPGQRVSSCTCPGSEHPGPSVTTGRNAPEIDVLEAQIDPEKHRGQVSQSFQVAPFDYQYQFNANSPPTTVYNTTNTAFNTYKGSEFQQAISAVSDIDSGNYNGNGYATYGFEYWSNPSRRQDGYITWYSEGQQTWTITPDTVGADSTARISGRIIPEEPMYLIMNFGMSSGFQPIDLNNLVFPAAMYIDYVRIYQREDAPGIGCSPDHYPTADYINNHINAYTNPNLTTWNQAGYYFPRNSLYNGC